MINTILQVNENCKKINNDYFKNYGGKDYSKSYNSFTMPAYNLISDLLDMNIDFNSILDVGCASGELVRDLRNLGVSAFGIENNDEILKKCVVPQYCYKMDIREINNIKPNTFDVIYMNSAMYLYPQEILDILKMFYKICKKAVYFYNPMLGDPYFEDPYRTFLASRIWWDKQFEEAGFLPTCSEIYLKDNV